MSPNLLCHSWGVNLKEKLHGKNFGAIKREKYIAEESGVPSRKVSFCQKEIKLEQISFHAAAHLAYVPDLRVPGCPEYPALFSLSLNQDQQHVIRHLFI